MIENTPRMDHMCHGKCGKKCPPWLWGCLDCWRRLPLSIREAIKESYRPGQEVDKRPSREYIASALAAERWVDENRKETPQCPLF